MKRVALLAAVIFPIAVLFYALHGNSKASTPAPRPNERDQPPVATTVSTAPSLSTPVAAPPAVETNADGLLPDGLLPVLQPGYSAVEQAAKKCWHDRNRPPTPATRPNGPDETIETIQLTYRQIADHGVGHIEEVRVGRDKLTDQALQACIVKAAGMVTWNTSAPDGVLGTIEHNVNIGDLMRPPPALPPPSAPPANQDIEEAHPASIVVDPEPAKIQKN